MAMMWFVVWLFLMILFGASNPAIASNSDLALVIEGFMAKQFPGAQNHVWVINSTERPAADEMVVDINTIVVGRQNQEPDESRFLLLIVEGQLTATQNIPLNSKVDCRPEASLAQHALT
jgi:hypothetical protein